MDFFQAQDFFKQMHPGKNISYDFDVNCIRQLEIIHTEGSPNPIHHLQYEKLKVTVAGMPPVYVPIAPHRACIEWKEVKKHINSLPDPRE